MIAERVIVLVEMLVKKIGGRPSAETVAAEGHQEAERADLVRLIRRRVAEGHDLQVHDVRFLKPGSIPKTTSAKIRRYLCRRAFLAGDYPP